jgi:hypothetical protein
LFANIGNNLEVVKIKITYMIVICWYRVGMKCVSGMGKRFFRESRPTGGKDKVGVSGKNNYVVDYVVSYVVGIL